MPKPRLFVEAGQRIGRGVVIDPDVRIPRSNRPDTLRGARLLCDCGNEYVSALQALVGARAENQRAMSCGCLRYERSGVAIAEHNRGLIGPKSHNFIDRTGQRFGRLVVIEYVGRRQRAASGRMAAHWLCKCDCGTERIVNSESLAMGRITSCGCGRKLPDDGVPGRAARNAVLCEYRAGTRERGLTWELTYEEFVSLTLRDCYYCGCPPSTVKRTGKFNGECLYNGIDRVDNDLGYQPGNVVSCCTICNRAKRDMPYSDFIAWIARLAAHQWFRPDQTPLRLLKGGA